MSTNLSVAEVLANLEAQIELHRRQESHHAEREMYHREQRSFHAVELENVTGHYEAFLGVAGSAAEVAARTAAASPRLKQEEEELPRGRRILRSRLVARVATQRPAGEPFTASDVAREVNRRFGKSLPAPADARLASAALRRLVASGVLRIAEPGMPHHEAQYARV